MTSTFDKNPILRENYFKHVSTKEPVNPEMRNLVKERKYLKLVTVATQGVWTRGFHEMIPNIILGNAKFCLLTICRYEVAKKTPRGGT